MVTFPVTSWVLSQAAVQKHPSGQQMAPMELKVVTHWGHSQQVSWNLPAGQRMQPPPGQVPRPGAEPRMTAACLTVATAHFPVLSFHDFFIRWIFV